MVLAAGIASKAAADDHVVAAQVGVPVALSLHGVRPGGSADGALFGTGQISYAYGIGKSSSIFVGGWTGLSIFYAGNELGSHVELITGGPELLWRPTWWQTRDLQITAGAGVGGLLAAVTIDENISRKTVAVGARLSVRVERRFAAQWSAGLGVGLEVYGAPLHDRIWFNRALGGTSFVTAGLSVAWTPG